MKRAVVLVLAALWMTGGAAHAEPARPADAFVDSVGVNTHLHASGSAYDTGFDTIIRPKLVASGIRHVRDSADTHAGVSRQHFYYARCRSLARAGIRFNLLTSMRTTWGEPTDYGRLAEAYGFCDGAVDSFEGVNEPDIQPIPEGAPDWVTQTVASQQALHRTVKTTPAIAHVPVIGPSITWSPERVGDLSPFLDYGNWHPYPGGKCPTCPDPYGQSLDTFLPRYRAPSGARPMVMTEAGYHNAVQRQGDPHYAVSELAAGKYMPRMLLEHFNRGFARTYIYELVDGWSDPARTESEANFGLLRSDGSEKPAFRALSSLLGLLGDPGPGFAPGALGYGVSAGAADLHRTLLQKRDGRFFLALWLERSSYDTGARANAPDDLAARGDLMVPDESAAIRLDASARFARVHRLTDDGSLSSTGAARVSGPFSVPVSDRVTVVEIADRELPGQPCCEAANDAPRLEAVRLTRRVLQPRRAVRRVRPRRGTRFLYTLSEPVTVTIRILRVSKGRRVGRPGRRRCAARATRLLMAPPCRRQRLIGVLRASEAGGRQSTRFAGRIRRRPLRPGRYRARVAAMDPQGARSAVHALAFRVVRR